MHIFFPYIDIHTWPIRFKVADPKSYLFAGGKKLKWSVRYKVAVGTARGLNYLHTDCPRRIIHRDIKASNILLGPDFEPQVRIRRRRKRKRKRQIKKKKSP